MRGRWAPATVALGAAIVTAALAAPPDLAPPRLTREAMEALRTPGAPPWVVVGTSDPEAAEALRARGLWIARRLFGGDSTIVIPDREATAERLAGRSILLLGGPRENAWTARLAPALPVQFDARGFRWRGSLYDRPGDAVHLVYPSPLDPRRFLLLIAGNSTEALGRGGGLLFGAEDWRIFRSGELVRSGRFAQSPRPWSYDPALDRDREAEQARFERGLQERVQGALRVRAPAAGTPAAAALATGADLLARLDALGLRARRPVTLVLYGSLEEKGLFTRDTRPEHVDGAGVAHAALAAGRSALDLGSVAQARLQALGAAAEGPWLEPAGAWLADRLEGEPLGVAVSRLYFARLWPRAREAARREARWRSPLIQTPARALLARAIVESAGSRGVAALLALLVANPPGTLDSLCRLARVDPRAVESRYAATADSLARAFEPARRAGRPTPWRPGDGFQRGVCLAHSVSLERGYLSAACGRQLESLRRMGANWVSLTPFGYLPDPAVPELLPSGRGGTDGETDQAVCEAAARARALGLRVWLAPHLWARGWTGELEFGAGGWPKFFERYREFILHYALLAERERMDGLVVGHELVSATLRFPDRWQALIAEVRRVYSGTLGYEANWGEEVRGIGFWDALDVVGVSFYDPLASGPTRSPGALGAGARKALDGLRVVGARAGRPVVLLEAGYPAHARAPIEPWVEPPGPADPEMQRLCYEALVQALEPDTWVAGVFFWKWPSSGEGGGPRDPSFTPRGKPAEQVMRRALESWRGRPVRVPRR